MSDEIICQNATCTELADVMNRLWRDDIMATRSSTTEGSGIEEAVPPGSRSGKGTALGLAYAVCCYAVFLGVFLYFIAFLNNLLVPKGIDDGLALGAGLAAVIDIGVVVLWGLQHSVMARPRFKAVWTNVIPPHTERPTYVLASALALGIVMAAWTPIDGIVWHVDGTGRYALWALQGLGWVLLLAATFEIDHFELFGLKQPWLALKGRQPSSRPLEARFLYRVVRHPIQTGVLVGMWATPNMTVSHGLFAGLMTLYIFVGLYFEERDLVRQFGEHYQQYRKDVAKLVPFTRYL